jgi:uncharacterized protein (DUF2267 family)
MTTEIQALKAQSLPDAIADAASRFLENPDPAIPRSITGFPNPWQMAQVGRFLMTGLTWNDHTRLLLRFFILISDAGSAPQGRSNGFLDGAMEMLIHGNRAPGPITSSEALEELRNHHSSLNDYIPYFLDSRSYGCDWSVRDRTDALNPFQNPAANLSYQTIVRSGKISLGTLSQHPGLFAALAIHQPEITREWCQKSATFHGSNVTNCWTTVIANSSNYDPLCLEYCASVAETRPQNAFVVLHELNNHREGAHLELLIEAAARPRAAQLCEALEILLDHRDAEVIGIMTRAFNEKDSSNYINDIDAPPYQRLFALIKKRWEQGGQDLLTYLLVNYRSYGLQSLLQEQLQCLEPIHYPVLKRAIHHILAKLATRDQVELWQVLSKSHPDAFIEDFENMWTGKSKMLRQVAVDAIAKARGAAALTTAHELLAHKKSDARLGAAALIESIANPSSIDPLRAALETESADAVRAALHQALKACGGTTDPVEPAGASLENFDLDSFLTRNSKGLKPPSCPWLDITTLPPLTGTDGSILTELALTLLITKQSKHKTLDAAPDILPLLAHIEREKSAPFAAALVEGFLNSPQAAADRWALTLGGLLGDNRIITLLLPRINDWCENSRHKLAEYAAQAISLLPGNEPLMVLDTLSNRYRSKFKNVGKACADAFNAAATVRGITADELGDMVVPDFGFDADGIRRFDWPGGGASAELGADFKLTWFDPATDKSWKSLPANAPEEIKTEVKTLTKLLREAVKGQTARLELTLVRQRRWPVARWRELYENHPLLRSFASNLLWGIYDPSGTLLRTFRRYPNGLLADAAGALEELTESDTSVGMIHPLELDALVTDAWRAHLARFKIKQPFPQLDRPVELMDPLHGNRRSISLTQDSKLSAGTFRSRAEKRGWARGSVIDAGGISSYYKLYPGAGVEVVLPTNNFYVGIDPMEEIELEAAYFATAGSVERGSYIYDEPAPDDPRVLRFDQVPTVVFSETLSDLKAIIATKE